MEAGDVLVVLKKDVQVGWWRVKRERDDVQVLVPSAILQPVSSKGSPYKQGIQLLDCKEVKFVDLNVAVHAIIYMLMKNSFYIRVYNIYSSGGQDTKSIEALHLAT